MSKPFNEHFRAEWDFTKATQQLHGDVIVEKLQSLPEDFDSLEKSKDSCLAYGEQTGHLHKLFRMPDREGAELPAFDLRIGKDGIRFLKVNEPIELKHQEHTVRVIPPGIYKSHIQREYDPFLKIARQVAD